MKNHSAYDHEVAEYIETAAEQLAYYDENGLSVIQDRDDVRYLAEEFGDDELARAAQSPSMFRVVLAEAEQLRPEGF